MMNVVLSPSPTATTAANVSSPVTVTLNYSPIDHNFSLNIKGATEVSYLLKYLAKAGPTATESTEQAIANGGKADAAKVFTATHLAGTESSGAKILHQVSSGGLEVIARVTNKTETRIYKTFTINDKGVIKVTDVTAETLAGMVQGASTDSASLNPPVTQIRATPMAVPVRTSVPTTMTDTTAAEITPTSTMPSLAKMWPFLAFVGGVLLLVLVGIMVRQRLSRPAKVVAPPSPPSNLPPTLPPEPPPVV